MLKKKFKPAFEGLLNGMAHRSIRIQFLLGALAAAAGLVLKITSGEWIAVVLCIGLVITTEYLNTAIEFVCNYLTTKKDAKIKEIKDLAAGAVLVSSLTALVTAIIMLLRHI